MKKTFIKKSILTILATIFGVATSFGQATITTGVLSPATVCEGGEVTVPFTTTGVTAPLTNFIAELSDATGSFAAAVEVGSATASPITAIIPAGTAAGATYKIRVISVLATLTIATGSESAALTVNALPAAPAVVDKNYSVGDTPVSLALSVTGSNLKWYAAATGGSGDSAPPTISTAAAGTKSYWVTQSATAGGCESPRAKIDVIVSEKCVPPAAPVVVDKNYIVGETPVSLALSVTGTNLKWYASATGGSGDAAPPTISTAAAGTKSYWVTQSATAGGCESPRVKIDVIVSEKCVPPAAPVVVDKTYNVGDTPVSLASSVTGTNLLWYTAETGGSGTATPPTISTAVAGTKSYWVTQSATAGSCESPRAKINVIVTEACVPPAAPKTVTKTYTVGDTPVSLASSVTGTNLLWYTAETGGTGTTTPPTISTAAAGTKSYWVTQSATAGSCESPRARIDVVVSICTPPAAPKPDDIAYCLNSNTVALTATGTSLKWYTAATGGTGSPTAPKPSSTAEGTTSYYVTQTVGSCESARAELKVTINRTDPPGIEDLDYCLNVTAPTLTATGTALKWYTAATGGTGSASAPTPTTNAIGTKSYFVTQTLNGCESPRAELKVTVKNLSAQPTVIAIVNLCQNSTATALTATGTALKWYSNAAGGTALGNAPVPVTTATGTTSYYVSQTAAGLCEGPRAKIDVVIKDTPIAPTVTEVNYCVGEKPAALTPSGGVYKWYTVATGGTGSATPPALTTTTSGTTSYYLTQSNTYGTLSCESPRAKKDVIVNPTPATLPVISDSVCQERSAKSYTFGSKAAEGNTLNWYTASTGGTATKTVSAVDLTKDGTTTYYATQLTAKGCESTSRTIQRVRVKPLPGFPTIEKALVEYCQFVVAEPLKATPVTAGILNWYGTEATGGTPSVTAPTPETKEGGTTTFYVGQTLEGCVGERTKIDVKINTTPKPTTKTYLAYCQNETAPILDATGTVLKWYREANGTDWQGYPFTPFTEKVQDYSFYVTQTGTDNGCESPKEEIKIHIKSLPSATLSGNSTIDLGQTATINIKFTGDGPWIYALSSGETDTTDQANHQVQVKPVTTTSYLMTEVSNACGKGLPIGSAVVTVKIPTINSGNPSVAEACAGKTFNVPFQQSGDFPAGNTFKLQISQVNEDARFWTVPSVTSGNSITATFPDTTKGGSYFLRVISSGENPDFTVKGSVSAITITASPLPVATLTGTQTILTGESADLKAEMTGKSPWTLTVSNGVKDTLITATNTPFTFKVTPTATSTYTITKAVNGCGTGTGTGSARVQVDPILGVEPPVAADWVKVYPTLIDSKFTIEITGVVSPKEANVEVIDLNGRSRAIKQIRQKVTDVEFGNYPSGLYLIRIQNGNLSTVQRVMKP